MLDRLASIKGLVEAEEYYAVSANPRFLAFQRRRLFQSVRGAVLLLFVIALLDFTTFVAVHPGHFGLILGVNAALAITAIVGRLTLDRLGPRAAEAVTFAVSTAVVVDFLVLGALEPEFTVLAMGYVVLSPLIVALLVPWRTWTHGVWLLTFAAVTYAFITIAPYPLLAPSERIDIAILASTSMLVSFVGQVLAFRALIRSFMDMTDIHALRHESETQRRASKRANAELELTARLDHLTTTGNRLRLHEDLRSERGRIERTGAPCGLLEADIDHFKSINDHLGHLAGDTVLREIAAVLKNASRSGDTVYRWGGEEFVLLLPGTEADQVLVAAERLRRAVEFTGLASPGNAAAGIVTVSIGATVIDRECLLESDDVWIGRADRAMYQAKAEGRNRVALELPRRGIAEGSPT